MPKTHLSRQHMGRLYWSLEIAGQEANRNADEPVTRTLS
jgi:hypothetical protein